MIYINILVNENSNYMLLVLPSWFDYFCSHDFLSVFFCCCTRSITFWPEQSSICSYYFYSWFTINNSFNLPNVLLNIINWQYFGNIGLNNTVVCRTYICIITCLQYMHSWHNLWVQRCKHLGQMSCKGSHFGERKKKQTAFSDKLLCIESIRI